MDWFWRLFDLFIETSKKLAGYLPQSGEDLIQLVKQIGPLTTTMNLWVADNIGVNLQTILTSFGRIIVLGFHHLINILQQIVSKL